MKAYELACWKTWKSLPWNKIHERIFIFQRNIYEVSKTYKSCELRKAQNALFNSNEAKIMAIESVFQSLHKRSIHYNQELYQLDDRNKFFIFCFLFKKHKTSEIFKALIEKIKQYLIYLCIQPEWEARFEPILQSSISGQGSYLFQEKLVNFLHYKFNLTQNCYGVYCNYQIANKYINPKYIRKKIGSSTYINYCLNYWLDHQCMEELSTLKTSTIDVILGLKQIQVLHSLLYKIICNGIEWFYMMTVELQLNSQQYNLYQSIYFCCEVNTGYWISINNKFINDLNFILKFLGLNINIFMIFNTKYEKDSFYIPYYCIYHNITNERNYFNSSNFSEITIANDLYEILFLKIKHLLYKKDYLNRLRANTSIDISKIILVINKLILQFYNYYSILLPLKIINTIYQKIDFIIYSWIKKKNKNRDSYKMFIYKNKHKILKNLTVSKKYIIEQICIEKNNR